MLSISTALKGILYKLVLHKNHILWWWYICTYDVIPNQKKVQQSEMSLQEMAIQFDKHGVLQYKQKHEKTPHELHLWYFSA